MKKNRVCAFILALLMLSALLSACKDDMYGYRVLETVGSQSLSAAFRSGDPISSLVPAALRELKHSGKVSELAIRWFGEDITLIEGEESAIRRALTELELEAPPRREFILGIDAAAAPYSFADGSGYSGFDVELARAVCDLLGFTLKIQPISPQRAETELAAGNIDCAWGGMSFETPPESLAVSDAYLSVDHLLIAPSDSGIKRVKSLRGMKIFMRDDLEIIHSMELCESLRELSFEKRFLADTAACFKALDNGECDAIIVDELAMRHHMLG